MQSLLCLITKYVLLPSALHLRITLNHTLDAIIRLRVYDKHHPSSLFHFYIQDLPERGELYQLSQVFSNYGYEPVKGTRIHNTDTMVSDKRGRIYFRNYDNHATSFTYLAVNTKNGCISLIGSITVIPTTGILVGSDFTINHEGWTIVGNKQPLLYATMVPYSTSPLLSHYIQGSDNLIHSSRTVHDQNLWYFQAPKQFTGNQLAAYRGNIEFVIGSFSGDFNKLHPGNTMGVIIECNSCAHGKGRRFGYPISKLDASFRFDRRPVRISISLDETGGWLEDPHNTLLPWTSPSQCGFLYALSNISSIQILGDWTVWYETVAIDSVYLRYEGCQQLPICSAYLPYACSC